MPKLRYAIKTTPAVVFFMSSIGATTSIHSPSTAAAGEYNEATTSVSSAGAWSTHGVGLPRMNLNVEGLIETDLHTQMAVSYEPMGVGYSSRILQRPLPTLSLIELYIGQYVLEHGTADDVERAEKMISHSDDDLAADFHRRYLELIDSTAAGYGLFNTSGGEKWRVSRTMAEDVVFSISQLRLKHPDSEMLEATRRQPSITTDGR